MLRRERLYKCHRGWKL